MEYPLHWLEKSQRFSFVRRKKVYEVLHNGFRYVKGRLVGYAEYKCVKTGLCYQTENGHVKTRKR